MGWGRSPPPPDSGPRCCMVRAYTHLMSDVSPRLRVLYTLRTISEISEQLIDEIAASFALNDRQKGRLRDELNIGHAEPSWGDVVGKLREPFARFQSALRSWEIHRDDASHRKLTKYCTVADIEGAYLNMRGLVYQKISSEMSWDTRETVERFARCAFVSAATPGCWDRIQTLLPLEHPSEEPQLGTPVRLYWDGYSFIKGVATSDGKEAHEGGLSKSRSSDRDPFCEWIDTFFAELDKLSTYVNKRNEMKA